MHGTQLCLSHAITGSFVGRIAQLLLHFLEETIDQTRQLSARKARPCIRNHAASSLDNHGSALEGASHQLLGREVGKVWNWVLFDSKPADCQSPSSWPRRHRRLLLLSTAARSLDTLLAREACDPVALAQATFQARSCLSFSFAFPFLQKSWWWWEVRKSFRIFQELPRRKRLPALQSGKAGGHQDIASTGRQRQKFRSQFWALCNAFSEDAADQSCQQC
mmetsp:Transcript_136089/g.322574  ORF Transcript_136089/g.322574 Transcript_136089/m.322574 type:complete len:220 (-) Transcript_136089:81-740(-)